MNEFPFNPIETSAPIVATKKDFLNLPENKKLRSNINASGIICYICAGITLLVSVIAAGSIASLLDVLLLVGLGLGVHLAQNKVCAIILLVYACINTIISIVALGTFGGWLVLLAGIFATIYTIKLDKAWKAYRSVDVHF